MRLLVTGDASGNPITVGYRIPLGKTGAFVYTCYRLTATLLTGSPTGNENLKVRLLTNWPNISDVAGVQGFGTLNIYDLRSDSLLTPGESAPERPIVEANDRFMLLYDPRARQADMNIAEIVWSDNQDAATYAFEGYGYYWDRSVLNAPGGPRHPGSS